MWRTGQPWAALTEQIDTGFRDPTVRAFIRNLWAMAPATLLVFAASAPPQCGAYILLAHDTRLLYAGSAYGRGGLRRRLGQHLAHVRASEYGEQWTIRTVWCKVVPTDDAGQAQVLELLTQRILRPAAFSTLRLRIVP